MVAFLFHTADGQYWWKIHRSFQRMLPPIWQHLQILTGFLMSNLDENFTEVSKEFSLLSDTISRFIRNLHVLQDSGKRLRGQVKSWLGSWCPNLMKIYENFQRMLHPIWHHLQIHQEPPCPSWLKDETKRKGRVFIGFWCPISMKISLKLLKDSFSY